MTPPRRKRRKLPSGGRGSILLVDDAPQKRTARAENLIRRGFDVRIAATITEAESLWERQRYGLVLVAVRKAVRRAAEFCERIKAQYPQQIVGMLVAPGTKLPPTRCPDLLWPEENLGCFLARVEALANLARAA